MSESQFMKLTKAATLEDPRTGLKSRKHNKLFNILKRIEPYNNDRKFIKDPNFFNETDNINEICRKAQSIVNKLGSIPVKKETYWIPIVLGYANEIIKSCPDNVGAVKPKRKYKKKARKAKGSTKGRAKGSTKGRTKGSTKGRTKRPTKRLKTKRKKSKRK